MKKKIINGILLVAMLFATTSAFVSCKDTDADYKSEMDAKYAQLEKKLADLQTLVGNIKGCDCADKIAALQAAIDAIKVPSLDGYLKTADLPDAVKDLLKDYYTKAEVDAIFDAVEEQEKDHAEIREYLAKFPNPNHLSFSELLAQNKAGAQSEDDEGYVLDIGSK